MTPNYGRLLQCGRYLSLCEKRYEKVYAVIHRIAYIIIRSQAVSGDECKIISNAGSIPDEKDLL